jgi:hypothetical protein
MTIFIAVPSKKQKQKQNKTKKQNKKKKHKKKKQKSSSILQHLCKPPFWVELVGATYPQRV